MLCMFSSDGNWLSRTEFDFLLLSKRLSANGFSTVDDKFSSMAN